MIEAKADVNHADEDGETALFYAVKHPDLEVTTALLKAPVDVKHRNNRGETVLMEFAKEGSNRAIAQALIEAKADVKADRLERTVGVIASALVFNRTPSLFSMTSFFLSHGAPFLSYSKSYNYDLIMLFHNFRRPLQQQEKFLTEQGPYLFSIFHEMSNRLRGSESDNVLVTKMTSILAPLQPKLNLMMWDFIAEALGPLIPLVLTRIIQEYDNTSCFHDTRVFFFKNEITQYIKSWPAEDFYIPERESFDFA